MKKILKIVFVLGVLFLAFQFIVNLLVKEHKVEYSLLSKDNDYNIYESYNKNGYYFKVTDKDKMRFNFYTNTSFNKQEKIIKDIKYYKTDDIVCILPIYKNKVVGNLACNYNNEQVSYSYLKQIGNNSVKNIEKELTKDGYKSDEWTTSETIKMKDDIYIYPKNIDDDYIFTIWFYKGIYIVDNEGISKKEFLDYDSYENDFSRLVGKYYVTFNTDNKSNYQYYEIITYNIQDGGMKKIELDNISLNSYINGVYDNKMYFTDLDSKTQYVVDPYNSSIKSLDKYKYYYNNKFKTVDKVKFFSSNKIFSNNVLSKKISNKYGDVEIKKDMDNYYFKTKDGVVYEVINNDFNHPIKLFQFSDLVEWNVKDEVISGISKNTLYTYTNKNGLRPVIVNDELIYNYKNICDFMKK